jgi:hypothetical protein
MFGPRKNLATLSAMEERFFTEIFFFFFEKQFRAKTKGIVFLSYEN